VKNVLHFIKLISRGDFPSGLDVEEYQVSQEIFDTVVDLVSSHRSSINLSRGK